MTEKASRRAKAKDGGLWGKRGWDKFPGNRPKRSDKTGNIGRTHVPGSWFAYFGSFFITTLPQVS